MTTRLATAFAASLLSLGPAAAQPPESVVVVGEPLAARLVGSEADLPGNGGGDRIYLGGIFDVELGILRVLSGRLEGDRLRVRLIFSNAGPLIPGSRLILLLRRTPEGTLDPVDWQRLDATYCLPTTIVRDYSLEIFRNSHVRRQATCIDSTRFLESTQSERQ